MKRSERAAVAHAIVEPYLTAKKDRTILTQYERVKGGKDGRVRTVLSPVVTETGRLASGESFVDPASTNLQNLSKLQGMKDPLYQVRDIFIPTPGMLLLASDLDKAEAVVAAFESEDWEFYSALIAGRDIHTDHAAHAFHSGNTKAVTKQERQVTKSVTYASLYMGSIPTITRTINRDSDLLGFKVTEAEVSRVYDTLIKVRRFEEWWKRVWKELLDPSMHGGYRWLENCFGFRRMFYNPDDHSLHKEAINFFPQSTVANKIDSVMLEAFALQEEGRFHVLLQVHDELLFEVRADLVSHYAPIIRSLMQSPFEARGRSVYIPAGLEVGERWGAMKAYEP